MAFVVQQHELATGIHVPPDPEPSSPSFPNLSLWVVPEDWLWVPITHVTEISISNCNKVLESEGFNLKYLPSKLMNYLFD